MALPSRATSSEQQNWASIVRTFPQRHVVVVGDIVADQFLSGSISRVSREAPVLILRHEQTETVPGGAANCATNLAALGARVSLVGAVGDDPAGAALRENLERAGVDIAGVVTAPGRHTPTKVRILAGQIHAARQQVLRIDYDHQPAHDEVIAAQLRQRFTAAASRADALVISDYNYGVADETMTEAVRAASLERKVPVLVDSRFRLLTFRDFTSATPNEDEVEQLLSRSFGDTQDEAAAGELLRQELGSHALLITRGSKGMLLLEKGAPARRIEAVGSRQPVDGTGAGDTVMAAYALSLAAGASFLDAANIANHAGGLVVMKRGTATVTADELLNSLAGTTEERSAIV